MTKQEMNELWKRLGSYRRNDPRLKDAELLMAWYQIFRAYAFSDAERALADFFREKKYWPEPSEIAGRCPTPSQQSVNRPRCPHSPEQLQHIYAEMDRMLEHGRRLEAGK